MKTLCRFSVAASVLISTFTLTSFAADSHQHGHPHEHREHGAHVHGSATLGIGFDGPKGQMDFRSPADSIYGFETEAKSPAQKKRQTDAFDLFEKNIAQMISFDSALGCAFNKDKLEAIIEKGGHSDVAATFKIECQKPIEGSKITFNIQKFFPRLKDVDVQVLAGALQKSVEANSNGTTLELK